jgi:hypothetical protein
MTSSFPAIANMDLAPSDALVKTTRDGYEAIPGWNTFAPEQRLMLIVMSAYGSQVAAARAVGKGETWLRNAKQGNRNFQEAIVIAKRMPETIATQYISTTMLPKAVLTIDSILSPNKEGKYDANYRERLQAAQLVFKMTGMDKEIDNGGGNRIYADNVNMFNVSPPVPKPVIEVTVVEEEK